MKWYHSFDGTHHDLPEFVCDALLVGKLLWIGWFQVWWTSAFLRQTFKRLQNISITLQTPTIFTHSEFQTSKPSFCLASRQLLGSLLYKVWRKPGMQEVHWNHDVNVATQKKGGGTGANNFLVAASKHGFADYEDCNVIRVRHVSEGPHWVCLMPQLLWYKSCCHCSGLKGWGKNSDNDKW